MKYFKPNLWRMKYWHIYLKRRSFVLEVHCRNGAGIFIWESRQIYQQPLCVLQTLMVFLRCKLFLLRDSGIFTSPSHVVLPEKANCRYFSLFEKKVFSFARVVTDLRSSNWFITKVKIFTPILSFKTSKTTFNFLELGTLVALIVAIIQDVFQQRVQKSKMCDSKSAEKSKLPAFDSNSWLMPLKTKCIGRRKKICRRSQNCSVK